VGQRLVIRSRPCGEDYLAAFHELARNTLRRIEAGPSTDDAYQVKSLLSQIMLLPALYLQARDGTAVFKKFSFDLAARDFPPATWEAMNRISAVRDHWHVELGGLRRLAMTRLVTHRRLVTRWLSPRVPDDLQRRLKGNTWQAVTALIHAMEERLADAAKVRPQLASGRGT
jgi:hypothetical protein